MKNIIYIGNFSFPFGNASGARVLGNGCALNELGNNVKFVGLDPNLKEINNLKDTLLVYNGFEYYNFPYPKSFKDRFNYLKTFSILKHFLKEEKPDVIILYGSLSLSLLNEKVRRWAKKNGITVYADCVDMLPTSSGSLVFKIVKTLDEYYQKQVFNFRVDGLIAISSYIQRFYHKIVSNSIIVPPLTLPERYNYQSTLIFPNKSIFNFVYVGNPFPTDGRIVDKSTFKDRLDLVIEVLCSLEIKNFVFRIYGLTKESYLKIIPEHREMLESNLEQIIFNGPINNEEAIELIKASDFSILLRNINKMSTAGFPTKFTESLACGTPMITNNTSDISNYLFDGKNGFLLHDIEVDYLKTNFIKILKLERNQIDLMKQYTFKNNPFDYTKFKDKFKELLND